MMSLGLVEIMIILGIIILIGLFFAFGMSRKPVPVQSHAVNIDHKALWNADIQDAIAKDQKIQAIKIYRELTGQSLSEAKAAIEYAIAHPDEREYKKHQRLETSSDAGLRDLIAEGKINEAVDLYQRFAGVDKFSARDAVEGLQREMRLDDSSLYGSSSSPIDGEQSEDKRSSGV